MKKILVLFAFFGILCADSSLDRHNIAITTSEMLVHSRARLDNSQCFSHYGRWYMRKGTRNLENSAQPKLNYFALYQTAFVGDDGSCGAEVVGILPHWLYLKHKFRIDAFIDNELDSTVRLKSLGSSLRRSFSSADCEVFRFDDIDICAEWENHGR